MSGQFTWGTTDDAQHQSNSQPRFLAGANAGTFFPGSGGSGGNGEPLVGVLRSSAFRIVSMQLCWRVSGFGSSYLAIDLADDGSYDITQPAAGVDGQGGADHPGDSWSEQCINTSSSVGSVARIFLVDNDRGESFAWAAWDDFRAEGMIRSCADAGGSSGTKWFAGTTDAPPPVQVYCDQEMMGGGWALAAVVSNTDNQDHYGENSWFSTYECELEGLRTPTPLWTNAEPFGDDPPDRFTTMNSKGAAFAIVEGNELLVRERQGHQSAARAYALNTGEMSLQQLFSTTRDHHYFEDRVVVTDAGRHCTQIEGAQWATSAFIQVLVHVACP